MDYFDGSNLEGFQHAVGASSKADYIAKGIETVQTAARCDPFGIMFEYNANR